MNKKFGLTFCLLLFALVISSLPAMATDLYNNLGTGTNVYNCCTGWTVGGSGTLGIPFTAANEISTTGGSISEILLGIGYVTGTNSFQVSLNMANGTGGGPGTQIPGALWTGLSSSVTFGQCCGLIDITGISGVTLPAGNIFVEVAPTSLTGTTWEAWNWNSTGATGDDRYSNDGGMTWNDNGTQSTGALEIVAGSGGTTPEPSSLLLLGTGVLGIVGTIRRKLNR